MTELNNLWLFAQVLTKVLLVTGLGPALAIAILVGRKLERKIAYAETHNRRLFLVPGRKRHQHGRTKNLLLVVRPSR